MATDGITHLTVSKLVVNRDKWPACLSLPSRPGWVVPCLVLQTATRGSKPPRDTYLTGLQVSACITFVDVPLANDTLVTK